MPDHSKAEQLTQQGITALKEEQRDRARVLLARALQLNPQNERAWLWLSGAVDTATDRRHCLRRVLAINPENAAAQAGLAQLEAPLLSPVDPPALPAVPDVSPSEVVYLDTSPRDEVITSLVTTAAPPPVAPALVRPVNPVIRHRLASSDKREPRFHIEGILYDLLLLGIATLIWLLVSRSTPTRIAAPTSFDAPPARVATVSAPIYLLPNTIWVDNRDV